MDSKNAPANKELVSNICTMVLEDFAPEEAVLVNGMVEAYLSDTEDLGSESPFGNLQNNGLAFADKSDLLTPVLIPVIIAALNKIVELIADSSFDQVKAALKRKKKLPSPTLGLDVRINKEIGEVIVKISGRKIGPRKARELANRIFDVTLELLREEHKS